MSAPAITPGPWKVYPYVQHPGQFAIETWDAAGCRHEVGQTFMVTLGDPIANARLIAAAPELYEALVSYVDFLEPQLMRAVEAGYPNEPHIERLDRAKAALAKARGAATASGIDARSGATGTGAIGEADESPAPKGLFRLRALDDGRTRMSRARAMGLAPVRAETPQAAQGRSPAGPVTRDSAAGAQPSETTPASHNKEERR